MNDTFNLNRFSLLLKKTLLERFMQIIGLIVITCCISLLMYTVLWYAGGWSPAQNLSYVWGFIGGGTILSSVVFSYFGTNAGGAAFLTLPASAFEKWLCGVLIAGPLFCAIFLGFYRVMDYSFVTAYHNGLDHNSPLYQRRYNAVHLFNFEGYQFTKPFIMYVNLAGAMLVGSLYFNKVAIVKVAFIVCGVLGIIYFLNLAIAVALFTNVDIAFPYYTVLLKVGSGVGNIELPPLAVKFPDIILAYILPVILWFTAYIRLREKEI